MPKPITPLHWKAGSLLSINGGKLGKVRKTYMGNDRQPHNLIGIIIAE